MSEIKNTGKFALVQRILDDSGKPTDVIRAYITDDIVLKKGQTVFFNGFEDDINELVKREYITAEEGEKRIADRRAKDAEYSQSTMYSLRAGNLPKEKEAKGNTL